MVHALLTQARNEGGPHLRPVGTDEIEVTFARASKRPVRLSGDFDDWEGQRDGEPNMREVAPGVWSTTMRFPRNVYMEYDYFVAGKRLGDPLNPRQTPNGIGATNAYFYGPDAAPSPWLRRQRGVPKGTLTRHTLAPAELIAGTTRTLYLYRPPAPGPVPLLVVLDGQDYLRRARLDVIVDNLIAAGRIRPIALAMIASSRRDARYLEYACSDATVNLITSAVLPFAAQHLTLSTEPGAHGVLGASMGGVMASYIGLRAPEIFGRVLSQSGAFAIPFDEGHSFDLVAMVLIRYAPRAPVSFWMDVGRYEMLRDCNQRARDLLVARGYAPFYREYSGGHNYPSWRNELGDGLTALFPPA